MLDKQIFLYSVDTGDFYSNHEKYLHDLNCKYRCERNYLANRLPNLEKQLLTFGYTQTNLKVMKNGTFPDSSFLPGSEKVTHEYLHLLALIKHKRKKAKESKEALQKLLANKVKQNEITGGKDHTRTIRAACLNDNRVVSLFDSALTRTIGIKQDELTEQLMLVQVYYFDVFKDIAFHGFLYKGEKYIYFTSSAGQIRKKKAVFIKESVWRRIEQTVMCGLTVAKINAKGGNNVNKHLAYMALTNSATDVWQEFDIEKSIVIDDFTTNVYGTFDFIDESDYSVTRKTDYVPITHTDGAGMVLPSVSRKNFMFRAPWIKGLLGVFDFKRFIEVYECSPLITDIYGQTHDIIKEDIQVIFTKSQFKMHRYYDSWEEYKAAFHQYGCTAGRCNIEESRIKNAKINYQMLQTLTDINDSEIDMLTKKSAERIKNICESKETMMQILGITPYNTNPTPLQKAIKLYPSLLADVYVKDVLRDVKDSLVKKYRSGKLELTGKYTFLLPDFYAACEYWFGHIAKPDGLLKDGEVYCRLFPNYEKLDCLRSPHLYREHAIRQNITASDDEPRLENLREWFLTSGLYTSTHDLISKLLQFDVDGDQSLVVAEPDFVAIAERNMKNVVPLYYNMRKAAPEKLTPQTIYAGLRAAFTGGNIGMFSNDISKIWNHDVFQTGTPGEQAQAITAIKLLCMENNFCIDFAKTLYKPTRPDDQSELITQYTHGKLPAFFTFAKDKDSSQTENRNGSFVNKIYDRIPNTPIQTKNLGLTPPDYRLLMKNPAVVCPREVAGLYDKLSRKYRYMVNGKDEESDNLRYVSLLIKEKFRALGYVDETIADMLVHYLFGSEKRYKQLLWFCYGSFLYENLAKNIPEKKYRALPCTDCGEWIEVSANNTKTCRCKACQTLRKREYERDKKRKQRLSPSAL